MSDAEEEVAPEGKPEEEEEQHDEEEQEDEDAQAEHMYGFGKMKVKIHIIQGRGLVAKDRTLFTQQRTTSDSYVTVYVGKKKIGKTKTVEKTVNPIWDETFTYKYQASSKEAAEKDSEEVSLYLDIWDQDVLTDNDPMGGVVIPLNLHNHPTSSVKWYPVVERMKRAWCSNATGQVEVRLTYE